MVKVHINNTKHITIANIYIASRDSTSTQYKPGNTTLHTAHHKHTTLSSHQRCERTLLQSFTGDHRGQQIADVIINSVYISTLEHTSLLISGEAIPDNEYKSSMLVGFRHPVTDRYA